MSTQLDNLIAILRDSSEGIGGAASLCDGVDCSTIPSCRECPFFSKDTVDAVVKELEVLQHAKA